ncbi:MAG: hypothetical protein QM705_00880 [Ancrocorticia sp.]
MKNQPFGMLAAVALLVGSVAGCGSSESPESSSTTAPGNSSPVPSVQKEPVTEQDPAVNNSGISPEVLDGVQAMREFGPSAHPDVYTGIATNDSESIDLLVIYLTTDDPAIQDEFRAASGVPSDKLRFEKSLRTESELQTLTELISADQGSLREAGIAVSGWGVGSGFVPEIYVDEAADSPLSRDEAAALIADRYGEGIQLVYGAPVGGDTDTPTDD